MEEHWKVPLPTFSLTSSFFQIIRTGWIVCKVLEAELDNLMSYSSIYIFCFLAQVLKVSFVNCIQSGILKSIPLWRKEVHALNEGKEAF